MNKSDESQLGRLESSASTTPSTKDVSQLDRSAELDGSKNKVNNAEIQFYEDELRSLGIPRDFNQRGLTFYATPTDLTSIGLDAFDREQFLREAAAQAWLAMVAAAALDDITLLAVSGYRSIDKQKSLIQAWLDRGEAIESILTRIAVPGYSEHQSGRAIDITTPGYAAVEEEFEDSEAYLWLTLNAAEYGFILSYPRDNPHGIVFEPWHWIYKEDVMTQLHSAADAGDEP